MPSTDGAAAPIDALRSATQVIHDRVEAGPFARAIAQGTLERASYAGFLSAMATIYGALDAALAGSPLVPALGNGERTARIARDLAALGPADLPSSPKAALAAEVMAAELRVAASMQPQALLGWLYVLEGAALGNLAQRDAVDRALRLGGQGVAFLGGEGKQTRARFERCVAAINAHGAEPAALASMLAAATEAFLGIELVLSALVPLDLTPAERLVAVLNAEAGHHHVAGDLREVVAALEAGAESWRATPYYAERYGERGLRFTRSDSAWLAALGRCEPSHVVAQVRWLAGVLASRGMPSLLLEDHLRVLHRTLSQAVPGWSKHTGLVEAARDLERTRVGKLSAEHFAELERRFDDQVDASERARLPRTGRLLAAAVADEAARRARAVESLRSFLVDPSRFSPTWIQAVDQALADARARLRS